MELLKATLQAVKADENQSADGDPIPVQFNPGSLRMQLHNQTDGGRSRGQQQRQHGGASSTTLSMDLIFDTADEGSDEQPVSVRSKTAMVEKFVLPKDDGSETPPLLKFQWDQLILVGVVDSLNIDFDHFAANGAPLRAKIALSIKEQEPKYTFIAGAKGAAARNANNAGPPGENASPSPGSGTNEAGKPANSDSSATALDGETAAEFLNRQGLNPAAWRGLDVDLSAGLSFEAGIEVGFNAALGMHTNVGLTSGVQANSGPSLQDALGLNSPDSRSSNAKKVNGDRAGLALSAAGGPQSAFESVKSQQSSAASEQSKAAYGISPAAGTSTGGAQIVQANSARTPLQNQVKHGENPPPHSAQRRPQADRRATSYGFGVPLRPMYPQADRQQQLCVYAANSENKQSDQSYPAFRNHVATAPWLALPQRDKQRQQANNAEAKKQGHPCSGSKAKCSC